MTTFQRLNERAKQVAILNVEADISADFEPNFEPTIARWTHKLESFGFIDPEIRFDLSLGEAVFDAERVDIKKLLEHFAKNGISSEQRRAVQALKQEAYNTVRLELKLRSGTSSTSADALSRVIYESEGKLHTEIFKDIEALRYNRCIDIVSDLHEEQEVQLTLEATGIAKFGGYNFDENGGIVR